MNTSTIIILLVLAGLIFLISIGRANANTPLSDRKNSNEDYKSGHVEVKENPYPQLRETAFSVLPEQLELDSDDLQDKAYGVIMDWDFGDAVLTVVAFPTGDASMYLSTGQIFMGGFAYKEISDAAKDLVYASNKYLFQSEISEGSKFPDQGNIKFHFLTVNGIYTKQVQISDIEDRTSNWTDLFDIANRIITGYRKITDE
jgi:hypothetical protein